MWLFKRPWVFWISVKRYPSFNRMYSLRGTNFFALYGFNYRLSIGMPWKPWQGNFSEKANKLNVKQKRFSVKINL